MTKIIDGNELKRIERELLVILDRFCVSHGLRYYIAYGTLIGAVRHKGFIPWDDDIDVFLPRRDYEHLIDHFNQETDDKCIQVVSAKNNQNYYLPIAKLIDSRTVLKEKVDVDYEIGVYIDLFPLDNLSNDYNMAKRRIKKAYSFNRKIMIKNISMSDKRSRVKNMILKTGKIILSRVSTAELLTQMDAYCKENVSDSFDSYVGVMCGISAGNATRVFRKEWFEDSIKLDFEGVQFNAPSGYDSLLKQLYGDYMKLPPVEDQVTHHVFEAWYK